jgi:hypothetical protein
MMDTWFCNKKFPHRWRSSIAVSAFEPDPATVPPGLCEGTLTFLKVTATITGYQPTDKETRGLYVSFPHVPQEVVEDIARQYFSCYGALLTVAVFPTPRERVELLAYPHIIDVEPKNRELVQAATETGEILTSSKSNIKTNKSLTHTENTETGFTLSAMYGKKDEGNASAALNHKNTETETENWSVATDASRERQEKEGSSTQVSQLYNLLSSYHVGTNRAQFLMLARPHVLQPTDHRTFVNGLRHIEGVQEFILIVARPPDTPGLCVEVGLETGHYPEGLTVEDPKVEYEESFEDFPVVKTASNGFFSGDTENIDEGHDVLGGWVVDTRAHRGSDPGHEGMKEIANNSNSQANGTLASYNYRRISDASVHVSGQITGESLWRDDAYFDRTYRVFTRSVQPKAVTGGPHVPLDRLLITRRSLCVCFRSTETCPTVISPGFVTPEKFDDEIVAEVPIVIERGAFPRDKNQDAKSPTAKAFLAKVQQAMTTSWRLPLRHPSGEGPSFLETEFVKDRVKKYVPREQLARRLSDIESLRAVRRASSLTVGDALDMDLAQFALKTGLSVSEAARVRRSLLGMADEAQEPPAASD